MIRISTLACTILCLIIGGSSLRADVVNVPATANIFGAGHSTVSNPGGGSPGTLPPEVTFTPESGLELTVTVSGTVSLTPGYPNNGDGSLGFHTNINSLNGISGIVDTKSGFLVGVFVNATEPMDPAPSILTFSAPENFTILSPLLNQTFFIGDGQTDSQAIQTFNVPNGASRLYLGFEDAFGYVGQTGQYQDNSGSLTVTTTVAPRLLGDVNFDGHVDMNDVGALEAALTDLSTYQSTHGLTNADINNDGNITNADLQGLIDYLQANNGSSTPVPEPSALTLLGLASLGLLVCTLVHR